MLMTSVYSIIIFIYMLHK